MTTATQNADSGTRRPPRPAPPPRRHLNLPAPMDGPLSRLADIGGDIRLAETLLATSNRYLAMIQHYMPTLTDREWGAIFDALRPPWTAEPHLVAQLPREVAYAIDTDRLDYKWGVDGRKLRTRLNRASYGERMAIGEMTMAFYRRLDDGVTGDVIGTITALFQPQAPEGQPPAHSRLSPALLLGDDAAEQTAAAYQAALAGTLAVTEAPPRPGTETETDPGDGGDGPQTETQPAGPPEGPETPAAPPPGPEAIAPEMALDTVPTLSPDSSDPETGVAGNEAAPETAPGDAAAALLAGLAPEPGDPEAETETADPATASGDVELATQAELSAMAVSDVETAAPTTNAAPTGGTSEDAADPEHVTRLGETAEVATPSEHVTRLGETAEVATPSEHVTRLGETAEVATPSEHVTRLGETAEVATPSEHVTRLGETADAPKDAAPAQQDDTTPETAPDAAGDTTPAEASEGAEASDGAGNTAAASTPARGRGAGAGRGFGRRGR